MTKLDVVSKINSFTDKHSPVILTATGIIGVVGTAYLAAHNTIRAHKVVQASEENENRTLSAFEKAKLTWHFYIPTAVCAVITISSVCAGNHIALKRGASLMQAYSLLDTTFSEYKEQVKKQIGPKKEQEVEAEIAQKHVDATPPDSETIIFNGREAPLTLDDLSGRYFRIDAERIRQAQNELNHRLLREDWVSLNVFYGMIGLDPIGLGDDIGWNADRMLDVRFSSTVTASDEPCLVLKYNTAPKPDYYQGY